MSRWLVPLLALLAACGGTGDSRVLVFAAASLTDAFGVMETEFEAANPGVDVEISYAGSSTLAAQLLEGAPAEVFASANTQNMVPVVEAGLVDKPVVFAANDMVLVVPSGNPGGVRGLADLERSELFVGLCAAPVPCGQAARAVLTNAGVDARLDTEDPDVRSLLTKIEAAELDAGIVYASDVRSAGDQVVGIPIDGSANVTVSYPIALSRTAGDGARAFLDFVLSDAGQAILAAFGFHT